MPALLDTTDDVVSFADSRTDAWHQLGQSGLGTFTAEQAMTEAHLGGWNVRKSPAFTTVNGLTVPMTGRFAIIRSNPIKRAQVDYLGDVGGKFTIIQNEEHAAFLNALVDESGAHFETAGALDGGRKVFITMKLPGHMRVGGVDAVDTYLVAVNSHDGSGSFTLMITPVRVVCQNTLNLALSNCTQKFKIRHTKGATAAVAKAREALELTFAYLGEFQETAERLINTTMTQVQFEEIIRNEFGAAADAAPATVTRTANQIEKMEWLFAEACTQENVCHTAWAGLNALTEWFDHYAPVRGDDRETTRAKNAVLDMTGFKTRALELMTIGA